MLDRPTQSKRLLSHIIAERACSLKYEHLSPSGDSSGEIILVRLDRLPLGGSQQNDARILLRHYAP